MPIFVYFHICTLGDYERIIQRMMNKMQSSGLLDDVDEVRYVVLGTEAEKAISIMQLYSKTKCIGKEPNMKIYERATLHRMREDCIGMQETAYIMYIHSKGVTHKHDGLSNNVDLWTDTMLDGLCTYRHLCWRALEEGNKTVGSYAIDYYKKDTGGYHPLHFSGNFWWASSVHIATLPTIGPSGFDPEMWIFSCLPHTVPYVIINRHPASFLGYTSQHTIQQYRSTIVFKGLVKKSIETSTMKTLSMGLENHWVAATLPSPGQDVSLSMAKLHILVDPHPGCVKMIRIELSTGETLYCLENEKVDLV
jgi:hypothetical protein